MCSWDGLSIYLHWFIAAVHVVTRKRNRLYWLTNKGESSFFRWKYTLQCMPSKEITVGMARWMISRTDSFSSLNGWLFGPSAVLNKTAESLNHPNLDPHGHQSASLLSGQRVGCVQRFYDLDYILSSDALDEFLARIDMAERQHVSRVQERTLLNLKAKVHSNPLYRVSRGEATAKYLTCPTISDYEQCLWGHQSRNSYILLLSISSSSWLKVNKEILYSAAGMIASSNAKTMRSKLGEKSLPCGSCFCKTWSRR